MSGADFCLTEPQDIDPETQIHSATNALNRLGLAILWAGSSVPHQIVVAFDLAHMGTIRRRVYLLPRLC
jgi:hypothetical protein